MNETRITQLLDAATRAEPPMGPVVSASMRAGDRLRRRRRIQAAAAVAALVALAVTVPAFAFQTRTAPSAPAAGRRTGTAFIVTSRHTVVPVNLVTGQAGHPIQVPNIAVPDWVDGFPMAAAPGGQTIWITGSAGLLTPISAQTGKAGAPIRLHQGAATTGLNGSAHAAVITGHGGLAYVAMSPRGVLAVNLTTRKVLAGINVPYPYTLAASPDAKLVFVDANGGLTVISTRTNTVLRTVRWTIGLPLAVTAAGDTAVYAITTSGGNSGVSTLVQRITVATGASRTFVIPHSSTGAVAPDGSLLYAAGANALYVVSPASGKIVARWPLRAKSAKSLMISPDGSTAYVLGYAPGRGLKAILTQVNLRTGRTVRRVRLPDSISPYQGNLAVSPDGQTVYAEMYKSVTLDYAIAIDARSGLIVASTAMRPQDGQAGAPDAVTFGQ